MLMLKRRSSSPPSTSTHDQLVSLYCADFVVCSIAIALATSVSVISGYLNQYFSFHITNSELG